MEIHYFPDLSSLFTELSVPPPVAATSVAECASYAFSTADTGTRATGFALRDGTCTLGRPPQFLDDIVARPALTQGEDGVYANIAKPTSKGNNLNMAVFLNVCIFFRSGSVGRYGLVLPHQ